MAQHAVYRLPYGRDGDVCCLDDDELEAQFWLPNIKASASNQP